MATFTYRLDTSVPFHLEEERDSRERKIKVLWFQLAFLFFEKGKTLTFKYWSGDLSARNGYSAFGIHEIKHLANGTKRTIDLDGLTLLQVELNQDVKHFVLRQIHKSEQRISPFFHFAVMDEAGESLCTSKDFGSTILMDLTISDLHLLAADGFDLDFLISLPETF